MVKRTFDILGAGIGLTLLSPVLLILVILIRRQMGSPVLFRQTRPGKDGKPFEMMKFRTMRDATGPDGELLPDTARLTPLGQTLRSSSLDELPELWNVLKGDMSLVGPRPPLAEEVAAYKPWHKQRLSVIGGITGLWQVSGRSDLTFDELCLLDIYYIENWSLALDIRILLQTIPHSLFGRGAY